ncbi:MAG: rod shape-determining protein MreC [Ginsengibacter sp.]
MRNIFIFIRIYFNFLFFLFLIGLSLYMLFSYNHYHHSIYSSAAAGITGKINKQYNNIEYYFQLKRTNDSLVKANENLYNKLKQDFELPDTTTRLTIDTINVDTIARQRKYLYMQAKVVSNSVAQQNNFMELHRGSTQGVTPDMGVLDVNHAVVGMVMDVSENFSVVMNLLNGQSNISAKVKKTGEVGSLVWDGKATNVVILKDIPKVVKVAKGDSVITSGFSDKFPYGLLIGRVIGLEDDESSSTHTIRVRTAANFYNLQYVYVINNLQREEARQLLNKVKKTNE